MGNIFYLVALWGFFSAFGVLGATYTFSFSIIAERAKENGTKNFSELKEKLLKEKNLKSMLFWGGISYLENVDFRFAYQACAFVGLSMSIILANIDNKLYGSSIMWSILIIFFNFLFSYAAKRDKAKFEDEKIKHKSSIPIELTLPKELA
ncbi:MAG: hypothetical protein NDI62_00005 [Burkholderiales bacterium]|nr:hypothetical protein [Burkholderiales bacterium]